MSNLLAAYGHAMDNRAEIEASAMCGCFCCAQIFPSSEIVAWASTEEVDIASLETFEGTTAMCPKCGSETVIGDKAGFHLDAQFLRIMNNAWMQRTIHARQRTKM